MYGTVSWARQDEQKSSKDSLCIVRFYCRSYARSGPNDWRVWRRMLVRVLFCSKEKMCGYRVLNPRKGPLVYAYL